MPELMDIREEAFCREVAATSRPREALKVSGLFDKAKGTADSQVFALMGSDEVVRRIQELRDQIARTTGSPRRLADIEPSPDVSGISMSQDWLRQELLWQYMRIRESTQFVTITQLLKMMGMANRLFTAPDLGEVRDEFADMTPEQLIAEITKTRTRVEALAKTAAGAGAAARPSGTAGHSKANGSGAAPGGEAGEREKPSRVH